MCCLPVPWLFPPGWDSGPLQSWLQRNWGPLAESSSIGTEFLLFRSRKSRENAQKCDHKPPNFTKMFRGFIQFTAMSFLFSVKKFYRRNTQSAKGQNLKQILFPPLSQAVSFVDLFNLRYARYESGYDGETQQ